MSVSHASARRLTIPVPLPPGASPFDVKNLLRAVLRRIHVIIGMLLLGLVLGYIAERSVVPRYTSSAAVLIDPKRPGSYGAEATFANIYVDSNKIASVEVILASSGLLSKVVKAENLATDPEFGAPQPSFLHSLLDLIPDWREPLPPDTREMREQRALERLTKAIKTTRVGMTYVITISVTTSRSDLSQTLAQAIAEAYLDDQVQIKYAAAQRDADWLSMQLERLRTDLIQSEDAVEAIRTKYGLAQTDGAAGSTIERQTITDINAQLSKAEGEVRGTKARYEQAQQFKKTGGGLDGLPEAASSKLIQSLRQQQADLNRNLADLRTHYLPIYPGRIRAEEDSKALEAQISAELDRIVDGLRIEAQVAVVRRDALQKQLSDLIHDADGGKTAEGRVQLREAERVADANRAVYDATLSRLREVQQQQTREEVEGRIISAAFEPGAPSFPKPILFLGAGGAVGMMLGLGLTVLPLLMGRRVVSAASLEQTVSLPILSMVPLLKRSHLNVRGRRLTILQYLAQMPLTPFSESLRALRGRLCFAYEIAPRVIQFTSATVGEGKSTIAASVAMSAAIAGMRTVLVDLDFYHPSMAGLFELPQREGVVDVLIGGITGSSALQTYGNLPLRIVSAGSLMQPNPDVVESSRFKAFIEGLTQQFDLVVLDTPPVLAVSNPVVISRVADATVLTVEWRETSRDDVSHAVEMLRAAGAPLIGIVLNKTDLRKIGRYDGKRYSDDSYYKLYGGRPDQIPEAIAAE